ncbi:hypothetical protein NUH87_30810 [Pseudomonas batumici]|uniref:hypothetical protein n=1 Tax=Pseudomonas batumici TaxID=226910 RepID=UPI0030D591FA
MDLNMYRHTNTRAMARIPSAMLLGCLLLIVMVLAQSVNASSMPAANYSLESFATAKYRDSSAPDGLGYAKSNTVKTTVQQVAGLDLGVGQDVKATAGGDVIIQHRLTNTGNGNDKFTLTGSWDSTQISRVQLVPTNGSVEGAPEVLTSGDNFKLRGLASEEFTDFNIVVHMSSTASGMAKLELTATSEYESGVSEAVTDNIEVVEEATFSISQSQSSKPGVPSEDVEITLNVVNGSAHEGMVALKDSLKELELVEDSIRINGAAPTSLPETRKFNSQVSDDEFSLAFHLEAKERTKVVFKAKLKNPKNLNAVNSVIYKRVDVGGDDKASLDLGGVTLKAKDLEILFENSHDLKVELTGGPDVVVGSKSILKLTVTNNSTISDSFALKVTDFKGQHNIPGVTRNLDGSWGTGIIEPGKAVELDLEITPFADIEESFELEVTAVSVSSPLTEDSATLGLTAIKPELEVTLDKASINLVAGVPELIKVTLKNATDAAKGFTDSYNLTAEASPGVKVTFVADTGGVCVATGAAALPVTRQLRGEESQTFCAKVEAKATVNAGGQVEFSALSRKTGATGSETLVLNAKTSAVIGPQTSMELSGMPGTQFVYSRSVINTGGNEFAAGELSLQADSELWLTNLYLDNGNKEVKPGNLLKDGKLPDTLDVGAQVDILVVVTIPENKTQLGRPNQIKITLSHNGTTLDSVSDMVSMADALLKMEKSQVVDDACATEAPGAFATNAQDIKPGQCVWYKLKVTNIGAGKISDIEIDDYFPAFVEPPKATEVTVSPGIKVKAVNGRAVNAVIAELNANEFKEMTYKVKVNNN